MELQVHALVEDLHALGQAAPRSNTNIAWLRAVFDDVEAVLKAGVNRQLVLDTLRRHGLTMTLSSFDSAMSSIRKERQLNPTPPRRRPGQTATALQDD